MSIAFLSLPDILLQPRTTSPRTARSATKPRTTAATTTRPRASIFGGLRHLNYGAFDIVERKDRYVIVGDIPGLTSADVSVQILEGRVLRLRGRRESDVKAENGNFHIVERLTGSFDRHFELPDDADASTATARAMNGVLTVEVAKRPAPPAVRDIAVATGPGSSLPTAPASSSPAPEGDCAACTMPESACAMTTDNMRDCAIPECSSACAASSCPMPALCARDPASFSIPVRISRLEAQRDETAASASRISIPVTCTPASPAPAMPASSAPSATAAPAPDARAAEDARPTDTDTEEGAGAPGVMVDRAEAQQ